MKKMLLIGVLLTTIVLMTPTFAEPVANSNWVMLRGQVLSYGGAPAYGRLWVFANVSEWAEAYVMFAPGTFICPEPSEGLNVTYSFYAGKLVSASIVELNYTGYDFYISGLWDVYNITWTYFGDYCNYTWIVELTVDDGTGELYVTGNWTQFGLAITGLELISGIVKQGCIKPEPVPIGDVTGREGATDSKVDIWDLVHVAKAYGSTPGMPNYDFNMDFDFNFEIDLCELTTIAANLGTEY